MGLIQKAFSDIVTFSRASNATRIGSSGLVEYAPHNLLTYSEDFSNAAYTSARLTIVANSIASPNGTVTADTLLETATTGAHSIYQAFTSSSGFQYSGSVYVKANGRSIVRLKLFATAVVYEVEFDLSLQTSITRAGTGTPTLTSVGNGWFRLSASSTATGSGTGYFEVILCDAANSASYAGDTSKGIYIWGAQLAVGPYALDYTPTTTAAVYGPRFDFDPVTLAAKGLLVEESRTNLFVQSSDFSTTWLTFQAAVTTNSTTAPDGTVTADTIASNATGVASVVYQSSVGSAATHTVSVYAKKNTADWFQVNFEETPLKVAWFNLNTGVVGTVDSGVTASIQSVGNGWYRCTSTFTMTAAKTISMGPCDADASRAVTSGKSVYLWGAQLEAGSFATSYIPTIASTVTRSADVASVNTLSPWYNATAGTLYAELNRYAAGVGVRGAFLNDGTTGNYIAATGTVAANLTGIVVASFSTQAQLGAGGSAVGVQKIAFAFAANDFALSENGAAVLTDTSGSLPTVNALGIGSLTTNIGSGHIRRIAYYPRRLTNAELTAISA